MFCWFFENFQNTFLYNIHEHLFLYVYVKFRGETSSTIVFITAISGAVANISINTITMYLVFLFVYLFFNMFM